MEIVTELPENSGADTGLLDKETGSGDSTAEVAAEVHTHCETSCQLKNSSGSSEGCGG